MCLVLQEAQQQLALIASHLLDCPVEDLCFQDRQVRSRHHPEQHVAFAQLAAAAYNSARLPPGVALGLDFSRRNTLGTSPYAFATHVAVVEVSQETGAIRVLKYVAVHDAGRIMNPLLAAGQVHGGIAQGIGQALLEGMVYSPEGQPLTGTLLDYTLPRSEHHPRLDPGYAGNAVPPDPDGRERDWGIAHAGSPGRYRQCRDGRAGPRRRAPY